MRVSEKIKKIRKEQGLTQAAFAKRLGVSTRTIINYERGERKPSHLFIGTICLEFDIDYDDFRKNVDLDRDLKDKMDYFRDFVKSHGYKLIEDEELVIAKRSEQTTDIGSRLKEIRTSAGLTQEDFAKSISGSRRQVVAWEKGEVIPSDIFLEKMSTIYNVSVSWLKTGKGEKYKGPGKELTWEDTKGFFERYPDIE